MYKYVLSLTICLCNFLDMASFCITESKESNMATKEWHLFVDHLHVHVCSGKNDTFVFKKNL